MVLEDQSNISKYSVWCEIDEKREKKNNNKTIVKHIRREWIRR